METKSIEIVDYNLRAAFFDRTQETLAIFDKDLNFIDANQALLRSLRLTREQIVGKNVKEISPGIEETDRYKLYLEVIKTGNPVMIDESRMHPSLGNFVSRISIFKVKDGIGLSALNITDLKEAIDELETFIYKASHDMRMPITNILGMISVSAPEIQDTNALECIYTINQQTKKLDHIIHKLVETAGIRSGDTVIHLIDFGQLIDEILKSVTYMKGFDTIKIEQNISSSQKFYSDKSFLVSIFHNLIDNAIKYQKEDSNESYLKISVEDDNDGVKMTFADNGIGIPEKSQNDIFNMFFRATNQASGSGLGLYTVKHSVKKLGGTISHDSKEKTGTVFTVYLPGEKVKNL